MKIIRSFQALTLALIIGTTSAWAQQMQMPQVQPAQSVSDAELTKFVDVAMDIQGIRFEADSLLMGRLEEEGMTTQRFQQIMMAQQNPNAPEVTLTTEEEETVANMRGFLQELSMNAQEQQLKAIQASDLNQQRFQSIAMALQQDKELAMRFQELIDEMESSE